MLLTEAPTSPCSSSHCLRCGTTPRQQNLVFWFKTYRTGIAPVQPRSFRRGSNTGDRTVVPDTYHQMPLGISILSEPPQQTVMALGTSDSLRVHTWVPRASFEPSVRVGRSPRDRPFFTWAFLLPRAGRYRLQNIHCVTHFSFVLTHVDGSSLRKNAPLTFAFHKPQFFVVSPRTRTSRNSTMSTFIRQVCYVLSWNKASIFVLHSDFDCLRQKEYISAYLYNGTNHPCEQSIDPTSTKHTPTRACFPPSSILMVQQGILRPPFSSLPLTHSSEAHDPCRFPRSRKCLLATTCPWSSSSTSWFRPCCLGPLPRWRDVDPLLVNWLYFCAIMMVHSGYLSLEKILPPQVVSSLLEGPKELGHPPHR